MNPILRDLLLGHFLPSLTALALSVAVLRAAFVAFRVDRPGTRYILYHLPVLKALLVFVSGVPLTGVHAAGPLAVGLAWPAPLHVADALLHSPAAWLATGLSAAAGAALTGYHWLAYRRLRSRLARAERVSRDDWPEAFAALDRLAPALGARYPRLLLLDEPMAAPFVVGFRSPALVLPVSVLDGLDADTLEAVLAHELAHLARHDGLHQWIMLLLANLLALNPLARPVFDRMLRERERDCDARAARLTGKPAALARALLRAALAPAPRHPRTLPALRLPGGSDVPARVLALTGPTLPRPGVTRRRALVAAPFVLFTAVQPHAAVVAGGLLLPVF